MADCQPALEPAPSASQSASLPPTRRRWAEDEDARLRAAVEAHGAAQWGKIASVMGSSRSASMCRERWHYHLSPEVHKRDWLAEEDALIIGAARTQSRWAKAIASQLQGRSAHAVRNRCAFLRLANATTEAPGGAWREVSYSKVLPLAPPVQPVAPAELDPAALHAYERDARACLQHAISLRHHASSLAGTGPRQAEAGLPQQGMPPPQLGVPLPHSAFMPQIGTTLTTSAAAPDARRLNPLESNLPAGAAAADNSTGGAGNATEGERRLLNSMQVNCRTYAPLTLPPGVGTAAAAIAAMAGIAAKCSDGARKQWGYETQSPRLYSEPEPEQKRARTFPGSCAPSRTDAGLPDSSRGPPFPEHGTWAALLAASAVDEPIGEQTLGKQTMAAPTAPQMGGHPAAASQPVGSQQPMDVASTEEPAANQALPDSPVAILDSSHSPLDPAAVRASQQEGATTDGDAAVKAEAHSRTLPDSQATAVAAASTLPTPSQPPPVQDAAAFPLALCTLAAVAASAPAAAADAESLDTGLADTATDTGAGPLSGLQAERGALVSAAAEPKAAPAALQVLAVAKSTLEAARADLAAAQEERRAAHLDCIAAHGERTQAEEVLQCAKAERWAAKAERKAAEEARELAGSEWLRACTDREAVEFERVTLEVEADAARASIDVAAQAAQSRLAAVLGRAQGHEADGVQLASSPPCNYML
mmetsp:Transcript_3543/g.8892  ORF Transcript_3543/g.8892 Transcript_3543/m.8892 type:complete len:705 (-) Transcript_3543:28-2142(-)